MALSISLVQYCKYDKQLRYLDVLSEQVEESFI